MLRRWAGSESPDTVGFEAAHGHRAADFEFLQVRQPHKLLLKIFFVAAITVAQTTTATVHTTVATAYAQALQIRLLTKQRNKAGNRESELIRRPSGREYRVISTYDTLVYAEQQVERRQRVRSGILIAETPYKRSPCGSCAS